MTDHVTLFGARPPGHVYPSRTGDGAAWLAYAAVSPREEGAEIRSAESARDLLQKTGGLLIQETAQGTSVDVVCSVVPKEGVRPPAKALWLRIGGADAMEPLQGKLRLSIGDHLILPVDGEAEETLVRFVSAVERFPEETRRLIVASLRRPALDWEVEELQRILRGEKGEKGASLPGGAAQKFALWKKLGFWIGAGVLVAALLGGVGYLGLRSGGFFDDGGGKGKHPDPTNAVQPPPPPPAPTPTQVKPPEAPAPQRFEAAMKELRAELEAAAPKDANLKALLDKLKDPDWKKNQDTAAVLTILFHRALGTTLDGKAYSALTAAPAWPELAKQDPPARHALLLHVLCETKPQPLPNGLPKPDACPVADLNAAASSLQWIADSLKHQRMAGAAPVR